MGRERKGGVTVMLSVVLEGGLFMLLMLFMLYVICVTCYLLPLLVPIFPW